LGRFLLCQGILDHEEYKDIVRNFPPANKVLPPIDDCFADILKYVRVANIGELSRERNTALLLLMSRSRFKLRNLLDLNFEDVEINGSMRFLGESHDLGYCCGGFRLGDSLEAYLALRKGTSFWVNVFQERLGSRYVGRILNEAGSEVGIKVKPYSVYSYSIRNSIKTNGLLRTNRLFGHSNINYTSRFMEVLTAYENPTKSKEIG
jgi:site-specific recombinase XerC